MENGLCRRREGRLNCHTIRVGYEIASQLENEW